MAGSSGGSLRGSGSARITFFVFLDIITAVTGILILVILLFALRAGDEMAVGGTNASRAATRDHANAAALDTELSERLLVLDRLSRENRRRLLALTDAENTADAAALRAELTELDASLTQAQTTLAQSEADRRHAAGSAAQEANAGSEDSSAPLERTRAHLARLIAENTARRQANDQLESDVKAAEARVLAAQAFGKNKLFLIPELPGTSKAPVLAVLSASGAVIERFNQPESRVTLSDEGDTLAFRKALGSFRRLDDYIVFYVRPSGVDRFDKYLKEARNAGFEVGYDAVDENRELIFAPRVD